MAQVRFPLPDFKEKDLVIIIRALRNIATGRSLANGLVTLTPSATSTVVNADWISEFDFIGLMPTTISAGAAYSAPWHIVAAKGSFTITHASNVAVDQIFRWYSAGG